MKHIIICSRTHQPNQEWALSLQRRIQLLPMWAMPLSSTALPTKFSDAVFWFLLSFPWGQRQYFPLSPSVICSHPTNPFSPPAPAVNVYPSLLPPSKTQVGLASCIEYHHDSQRALLDSNFSKTPWLNKVHTLACHHCKFFVEYCFRSPTSNFLQ